MLLKGTETKKKRGRKRGSGRPRESAWYNPTIKDVYAQIKVAETMLIRIPDPDLAIVKREMGILEDMIWQFTH